MAKPTLSALYQALYGPPNELVSTRLADYELVFAPLRERPLRLLHLGTEEELPQEIWSRYFHNVVVQVVCASKSEAAAQEVGSRLVRIAGDCSSMAVQQQLRQYGPLFDIVIDNLARQPGGASMAWQHYLPLLADGGVVVLPGPYQVGAAPVPLANLTFACTVWVVHKAEGARLGSSSRIAPASLANADRELRHLKELLEQREAHIAAMYQSTSWRLTRAVRAVSSTLQRTRRAGSLLSSTMRRHGGPSGLLKKGYKLYRREGWSGIRRGFGVVAGSVANDRIDYAEWVRRYDTLGNLARAAIRDSIPGFARRPLISVLMPVYNAPAAFLDQAIWSVRNQLYSNWELCIADDASTKADVRQILERHSTEDPRVRVVYREQNGHISASSNSALALAEGEYVALLDHDDLLAEQALYRIVEAVNRNPGAGLLYSDEDKVGADNRRYDPYFKPDMNYELMLAHNMVCHLAVYRTELVRSLGGFRTGFEGAQDYDLALRVIENLTPAQVVHLPYVLYHWRAFAGSTALAPSEKNYAAEAGRQAVRAHLARTGVRAEVMPAPELPEVNRVRFDCPSPQPLVSILIPTRDRADLLGMCLDSLVERTTYVNYEVIIIDNGSVEEATAKLFARLPKDRFRVVRDDTPFNFSVLNNHAARIANGEFLCLMNNDIEILTPDWLEEMVSFAARPEIGCVGARLWYPDGRLQHGGCVIGIGGVAGHAHKYLQQGEIGYFGRAVLHQAFSAVTAACLLLRREVYEEMGGLDEQLVIAFNDVDFCLRVREAGYRNVWTPYAEMIHHESASRGEENTPAKQARFNGEVAFVKERWGDKLLEDPAYSPNLTMVHEDFSYAWPPRVAPI